MSLLEVQNVESGYGRVPVLHGISLVVEEGSITAVLGPNGAGKTTLMRTIFGVLPLTSGQITFDGQAIHRLSPNQIAKLGIGYVPQERNVFPDLTVRENLEMGAFLLANPNDRIEEVCSIFPVLAERSRQAAGTLSGGERQMLAIGCALLTRPKLLLLDEPTSGLSPAATEALIEKILEINRNGTAIVWVVEENPREVLAHADHAYLLESGMVKKAASGRAFLEDERFEELFLGQRVD